MNNAIEQINDLPSIRRLEEICQALALLEAILMPEWEYRYFSFNSNWDESRKEMMASMRDGAGAEYFILFSEYGAVGKVFYQERLENPVDVLSDIPGCFTSFTTEVAFNLEYMSFCFWRQSGDEKWFAAPGSLPKFSLLKFLTGGAGYYHEWAENYYEKSIDIGVIQRVYDSRKVTNEDAVILNPDIQLDALFEDLEEILGGFAP